MVLLQWWGGRRTRRRCALFQLGEGEFGKAAERARWLGRGGDRAQWSPGEFVVAQRRFARMHAHTGYRVTRAIVTVYAMAKQGLNRL
jgi:hypothetical protein